MPLEKSKKPKGKGLPREFELAGADELIEKAKGLLASGARLVAVTGVDTVERLYVLYTFEASGKLFTLRVPLYRDLPSVESICKLAPGAALFEREVFEMLGVEFRENPRGEKTFLADDYSGPPPLRKPEKKEAVDAPPWVKREEAGVG